MSEGLYHQKKSFFDEWSKYYDCLFPSIFYKAIHCRMTDYISLKEDASILDLGCGTGQLLDSLAFNFSKMRGIGLDVSSSMLEKATENNRHGNKITFIEGKVESLPFSNEEFDAVFCTMSFLHFQNQKQVLREINRVLFNGGRFYLVDICGYLIDILGTEDGYSTSYPKMGKINLYNKPQRERLGLEANLFCTNHHYLLPEILLSIFIK